MSLSSGQLGLLLPAAAMGTVLALPSAGAVVHRLGANRTVWVAMLFAAPGLAFTGIAAGTGSPVAVVAVVAVGLFAFGYGSGTCDVAMNVEAAAVERRLGRNIMPRFHAVWSIGSVAEALLGAGAARVSVPVDLRLGGIAGFALVGCLVAVRPVRPVRVARVAPDLNNGKRISAGFRHISICIRHTG